jgi:hypothetical protein
MGLDFPGVQSDITGQPSAGAAESPKPKDEPVLKEAPDHHDAFRQTSGYWEMVYGMARHGIIQPDFLVENNGEGLVLYARIEPYLEAFRQATWSGSFGTPNGSPRTAPADRC